MLRAVTIGILFGTVGFLASSAAWSQGSALPPVPFAVGLGHEGYKSNCAACHGQSLQGSPQGPPLNHGYYHPGHHSDVAFYRAISKGVQQHHWNFGNMPAIQNVQQKEAEAIVRFIRWAQQAMGLY
ncbi:MAG: c-type cytochrome [Arenicellales bacterium]